MSVLTNSLTVALELSSVSVHVPVLKEVFFVKESQINVKGWKMYFEFSSYFLFYLFLAKKKAKLVITVRNN